VIIEDEVFAQEQAFDVVTAYKVATVRKIIEGDGIGIRSYTNCLNIKAVGKVFKGEDAVK
jgi:hypothetical protein